MNLLLDTNILLALTRDNTNKKVIDFVNPDKKAIFISVVSIAEIYTIASLNNWGIVKYKNLHNYIKIARIIEITNILVKPYIQIDTFSKRSNSNFSKYEFDTPRNVGKNDLWIASTASFLNLKLVTTDQDFDHLNNIFFEVNRINPTELSKLFK